MDSTTIANLTELRSFLGECQQFETRMKKSMTSLGNAIQAAGAHWKDEGYKNIQQMTANVNLEVLEIEKTVSTKIIPFVQDVITSLESAPY